MVQVVALVALILNIAGAGVAAALSVAAASIAVPALPGYGKSNRAAIAATQGVRRSALQAVAYFFFVAAVACAAYVAEYGSTGDFHLTTNTARNIYPLSAVGLLVCLALWAGRLLMVQLAGESEVLLSAAASGAFVFLLAQVADASPLMWGFIVTAFCIALVFTGRALFLLSSAPLHPWHWTALGLYGLTAVLLAMLTFFTYNVNVFGQDNTIYYAYPWVVFGAGGAMVLVSFMASIHTVSAAMDMSDEPLLPSNEELAERKHRHRGHQKV